MYSVRRCYNQDMIKKNLHKSVGDLDFSGDALFGYFFTFSGGGKRSTPNFTSNIKQISEN